jgi:hypothetical protein
MNISKKLKDKLATGSMMISLFFQPVINKTQRHEKSKII